MTIVVPGGGGGGGGSVDTIESTDGSIPTITNPSGPTVNLTGTGTLRNLASSSLSITGASGPNADIELPVYSTVYADLGSTNFTGVGSTTPATIMSVVLALGVWDCTAVINASGDTSGTAGHVIAFALVPGTAVFTSNSANSIGARDKFPTTTSGDNDLTVTWREVIHVTTAGTVLVQGWMIATVAGVNIVAQDLNSVAGVTNPTQITHIHCLQRSLS